MSFADLFLNNPMLIDVRRYWRRFFGVSRSPVGMIVLITLFLMCYGLLVFVAITNRSGVTEGQSIYFQTVVFCLIAPSFLHGAIAGEREKRTWDLLAVAPISKAQIVIGKFISGMVSIAALSILFAIIHIAFDPVDTKNGYWSILHANLISIGYAVLVSAVTLLISASSRRSFSALAGSYGLQVFALILWPVLTGIMFASSGSMKAMEFLNYLHPFWATTRVMDKYQGGSLGLTYNGFVHFAIYLAISAFFIYWAIARAEHSKELSG